MDILVFSKLFLTASTAWSTALFEEVGWVTWNVRAWLMVVGYAAGAWRRRGRRRVLRAVRGGRLKIVLALMGAILIVL